MSRISRVMGGLTEIDGVGRAGLMENVWDFFVAVF